MPHPPDNQRQNKSSEQPVPANAPVDKQADSEHPGKKGRLFHGFGPRMMRASEIALAIAGLVAIVVAIKSWQESAIEKALQKALGDEMVLRKVAEQAQPMLIFDDNGGFISDSGGLAYIDKIATGEKESVLPKKILNGVGS